MNGNWLTQYIRESQCEYPSISGTPVGVLSHMMFCNGNGVEIEDGNFVQGVQFWRSVPFEDYYKEQRTFKEMVEQGEDYRDHEVEKLFESKKRMNKVFEEVGITDRVQTDDELWREACKEDKGRYDEVDVIDNYTAEDLTDSTKLVAMIKSGEYDPYLNLSAKYYKLYFFNKSTGEYLLRVGKAMCEAYLTVLSESIANPLLITKSPICAGVEELEESRLELVKVYTRDCITLKKDLVKINKLLARG